MPQVSLRDDLKTAAVLAGATAGLGMVTVPILLPSVFSMLPPEQRVLPLPLPIFSVLVGIQFLVIYGSAALAGLRLAQSRDYEPAPFLTAFWTGKKPDRSRGQFGLAFLTGLVCGVVLVGVVALIKHFLPLTLPAVLHPPSFWGSLSASATASFGEEILCRLFLLSLFLKLLPVSTRSTWIAVAISSLLFGILHGPSVVYLFGGLANVPHLAWVWVLILNGFVGLACAYWYLRVGIGAAILVHFGTDLIWHVVSQLT